MDDDEVGDAPFGVYAFADAGAQYDDGDDDEMAGADAHVPAEPASGPPLADGPPPGPSRRRVVQLTRTWDAGQQRSSGEVHIVDSGDADVWDDGGASAAVADGATGRHALLRASTATPS